MSPQESLRRALELLGPPTPIPTTIEANAATMLSLRVWLMAYQPVARDTPGAPPLAFWGLKLRTNEAVPTGTHRVLDQHGNPMPEPADVA